MAVRRITDRAAVRRNDGQGDGNGGDRGRPGGESMDEPKNPKRCPRCHATHIPQYSFQGPHDVSDSSLCISCLSTLAESFIRSFLSQQSSLVPQNSGVPPHSWNYSQHSFGPQNSEIPHQSNNGQKPTIELRNINSSAQAQTSTAQTRSSLAVPQSGHNFSVNISGYIPAGYRLILESLVNNLPPAEPRREFVPANLHASVLTSPSGPPPSGPPPPRSSPSQTQSEPFPGQPELSTLDPIPRANEHLENSLERAEASGDYIPGPDTWDSVVNAKEGALELISRPDTNSYFCEDAPDQDVVPASDEVLNDVRNFFYDDDSTQDYSSGSEERSGEYLPEPE